MLQVKLILKRLIDLGITTSKMRNVDLFLHFSFIIYCILNDFLFPFVVI